MHVLNHSLVSRVLAQLADWLKGVLNRRAAPDDDSRFPFHPDTQRERLASRAWERGIERSDRHEARTFGRNDRGWADPLELRIHGSVALIRKGREEEPRFLLRGEFR